MGKYTGISIFSDFDGTLSDIPNSFSDSNKQAIKYFIENGGEFSLATGKLLEYFLHKDFEFNGPMIFSNGSQIYDTHKKEYIKEYYLDKECNHVLRAISEKFPSVGIVVHAYDTLLCLNLHPIMDLNRVITFEKIYTLDEFEKMDLKKIIMFTIIGDDNEVISAKNYINENYDDIDAMIAFPGYINVVRKNVNKGSAIRYLRENYYKDKKPLIIAIGDSENDKKMLIEADISFAVGNATDEIKQAATYVINDYRDPCMPQVLSILDDILIKRKE